MKSYFLVGYDPQTDARAALSTVLPGQTDPWLIMHTSGDPVAYLNIGTSDGTFEDLEHGTCLISADISGRHYYADAEVIAVLDAVRQIIGGRIINDEEGDVSGGFPPDIADPQDAGPAAGPSRESGLSQSAGAYFRFGLDSANHLVRGGWADQRWKS